jgi:MoaA/NifB/PqqE/SkfB family radical SAM enzyme
MKREVWEDFFFVITDQDYVYPCQHIDHEKYDSIGDKKRKKYVYA